MTVVFDLRPHRASIATEMNEWLERFPPVGDKMEESMRITRAWKTGNTKLSAEQFPKKLVAQKPRKSWPDMFKTAGGLMIASGKAKDIIDGLDTGLHQFFPLKIHTKRGLEVTGPWFAMNVTEQQNSIVLEKTRFFRSPSAPEYLHSFAHEHKDVTVDPSRQSGVNLWREYSFQGSLLGSDALFEALKDAGLKFYHRYKAKEL